MIKKISLFLTIVICISTISLTAFAKDVELKGKTFTIDEEFSKKDIPDGFAEANISFEGESFKGIANGDDTVFKFYLKCKDDESKNGWYTYLGKGQFEVSDSSSISINGGSLSIEEPDEDIVIPDGIVSTTFTVSGTEYTGYVPKSQKDEIGLSEYLVYGTLDGIEHAWFLYNVDDNMAVKTSIDNYGRTAALEKNNKELNKKNSDLVDKYNKNMRKSKYLFLFMCVTAMLFLFLMINAIIKRKHMRMDMEDRILDLRLHGGKDTMKISKKDFARRNKKDALAMERNDISPSAFDVEPIRRRDTRPDIVNHVPDESPLIDIDYDTPKKKSHSKKMDPDDLDIKSIERNMRDLSGADDFDDDIEFVSLDL